MSGKTKFKVCKTDLGMDKIYPEGSIVELDTNEKWVMDLVLAGNLVPVVEGKKESEKRGSGETEKVKEEETKRPGEKEAEVKGPKSKFKGQKN